METHFSNILAPTGAYRKPPSVTFIEAKSFEGKRVGYKFQKGSKGLGYYFDRLQSSNVAQVSSVDESETLDSQKKRKRDDDSADGEPEVVVEKSQIDKLFEAAEASDIVQLDQFSLRQLLLSFEKKITKNQKMRMKFVDEPEKFMDSELELHTEIQELFAVAASPELYPIIVQTGAVNSILGCVTHENTDISIAAVSLLQEMTEVDTVADELEAVLQFVDAFVASQGLELVVQNMRRLDESSEEDSQGVQHSLAIIENLVEIDPEIAITVCQKTNILQYLLERCKSKQFDANKLYASEVLSILLQADTANQVMLCSLEALDGMDTLLQCIALYRKKDVVIADEQECVENLFLSLCAALQPRENQIKFEACEGFELMFRCLKEQQYAAGCTIHALSYAVMKNRSGCRRLVDVGGMKYIFPLLTGGGMKKALKKKGSGEKRNLEDSALSIVAQMCALLCHSPENAYAARLLNKFVEREYEKLDRLVELFGKYARLLRRTEGAIAQAREELLLRSGGDEDALEEFDDEDRIYSQRLEGGLFNLQQVAIILAFACIFDRTCLAKAEMRLGSEDAALEDVLDTLRDMLLTLRSADDEAEEEQVEGGDVATTVAQLDSSSGNSSSSSGGEGGEGEEARYDRRYKLLLTEWCAALSNISRGDSAAADDDDDDDDDIHANNRASSGSSSNTGSN